MRFYTNHHQFYCGIDLHARQRYVCVLDQEGEVQFRRNMPTDPEQLARVVSRFGSDMVIGVECKFSWYWLADFCEEHQISFALGHALYMKAIQDAWASSTRSVRPAQTVVCTSICELRFRRRGIPGSIRPDCSKGND